MKRIPITAALVFAFVVPLLGQQPPKPDLRELTLESIYDPKDKVAFAGAPQSGFVWIDDKTFAWPHTNQKSDVIEWLVYDAASGATRPLFDPAKLKLSLKSVQGLTEEAAAKVVKPRSWNFSPNKHAVLVIVASHLYLYDFDGGTLTRLTNQLSKAPGDEEEASFSPDGKSVAFIRKNDLYVVDLATKKETRLTKDGGDDVFNGSLDWVYQEEVYGRGNFHGYWWSPDSKHLAYLRLDEKPVKRFAIVDHIPTMQKVEEQPYPKAGFPNPIAKLFTIEAAGGAPREIDTQAYKEDFLIVNVDWSPDSKRVIYQVANREQTWLDVNSAIAGATIAGAAPQTLFRESTKAWIETGGNPVWLKDGSFLWLTERSGFKHIYHYDAGGKLLRQVTSGSWEARTLHGVDAANQWIYFSGTERSVLGTDVYRVKLDGSGLKRLSDAPGAHNATFNPTFSLYIDGWSDVVTPTRVSLLRNDGTPVRLVDANEPATLRQYRLSAPEFVQVKARDGFVLEAMIIKPPNFDPAKKYPVYEHTYAGPHAQQVRNQWGGSNYLWHQMLAQRGAIVWIVDNRTASGKGVESAWPVYKRFGETELRDLEDGLKWLTSQPWVDGSRVLLNGWSFGGFMTSYALTHSTMWSAGIAGGSVTDWRDYDSIYTERYMLTPQNNEQGYKETAPRWAAKDLHGNLLLLHGAIDDNVHVQNTMQFAYELQKAGKLFRMMLYPKSRHGVTDPALAAQLHALAWRFVEENLFPR
jgi:dipeptidyl-peptidase-4